MEDLFFWSSPNFGLENRTVSGWKNFHSDVCSQIFWSSWPPLPLSKIQRTLLIMLIIDNKLWCNNNSYSALIMVLILKCRVGSRDVKAEAGSGNGKFSWKRKLEAVKRYRFHFSCSYRTSKLECGAIFQKISDKKWMFDDHHLQRNIFQSLRFT